METTLQDVLQAGRTLFGPAFSLERAWQADLKRAYRRRAMESHPDRAIHMGRDVVEMEREFRAVTDAYRVLSELPEVVPAVPRAAPRAEPPPRRRRPAAPPPSTVWQAPAHNPVPPRRRLRFAEYLYHLGRVPWQSLIDALVWQRSQRPAVGKIAVDFGFLRPGDVGELLALRMRERSWHVPFAEFAVHQGMLTAFQRMASLGRQRRMQQPIGQFFVANGFISDEEIEEIRRRLVVHNARLR